MIEDESKDSIRVEVDPYHIKIKLPNTPNPNHESGECLTVGSVLKDIGQSLLRLCRDFFGLPADVLSASRSFVRGVAKLPGLMSSWADPGRRRARENEYWSYRDPIPTPEQAARRLRKALQRIRSRGNVAYIGRRKDGTIIVVAVKPEAAAVGKELARIDSDVHTSSEMFDKVAAVLVAYVSELTGYPDETLDLDKNLSCYGVNESQIMEMISRVSEEFKIPSPPAETSKHFLSLGQISEFLSKRLTDKDP